jgi:hypothetical protein
VFVIVGRLHKHLSEEIEVAVMQQHRPRRSFTAWRYAVTKPPMSFERQMANICIPPGSEIRNPGGRVTCAKYLKQRMKAVKVGQPVSAFECRRCDDINERLETKEAAH